MIGAFIKSVVEQAPLVRLKCLGTAVLLAPDIEDGERSALMPKLIAGKFRVRGAIIIREVNR